MRQVFALFCGVFMVMALSNAIVPILPAFAEGSALQGAIYAAYFFGALVTVFPAGALSDRFGQRVFIQSGLFLTFVSGIMILVAQSSPIVLAGRLLEGVAAGLFVPAGMSWMNSQKEHARLSGGFMAALNLGLLAGLFGTGWIDRLTGSDLVTLGIWVFTILSLVPLLLSLHVQDVKSEKGGNGLLREEGWRYLWLYVSVTILLGATGVVSSLYPEFSGGAPSLLSLQIGLMHTATMITVYASSQIQLQPVLTIRATGLLMAVSVLSCYLSPIGFLLVGAVAGVAINAQLAFLAETGASQGAVMGLFNVSSYAGMSLLPFIAGILVEYSGNNFLIAFVATSVLCLFVAMTIGRCSCRLKGS
ncbi:MAG: MFS transporter [Methanomicrobiales archaeon]|nr:MFS transporter [Methanomicrobiales archaeon]